MSEETNNEHEQEVILTPEELAQKKKDLIKFYKEQQEILKPQNDYYNLLAEIEENKLRRLVAMVRQGQIMSPQDPDPAKDNPDATSTETPVTEQAEGGPKKERVLKKS